MPDNAHGAGCTEDRQPKEQYLQRLAYYDKLTGLPKRTLFFEHTNTVIAQAQKKSENPIFAILFMDLDDFKSVNDTFGHDFGDLLLKEVALRCRRVLRKDDLIARFSGNEFVIFLHDLHNTEEAEITAKRLIETLGEPVSISHHRIYAMASIGISCYPRDGCLTKTLIKKADIAMYKAKESGKNQYRYYDKPLEKAYRRARNLMRDLTDALEYDQFFLVYQPQFDLRQKRFSGAEVLIRWQHPKQGLISPVEFIPLAEMNGMINPITERILIEVASNFTALKSAGRDDFTLSVNISPRTLFDREFVPNLTFLLEHYPLPPGRLRLELTENTFMKNMDELARKLTELSALGIHLEIDDFGTGFTSLNYLINLPINSLKIDRSYIIALHQNDKNRAISQAVITLGHQLGQEIIAEGAESKEEVNTLRTLGADKIQGYYYSKPLRFAALLETLQTQ